MAGGDPEKRRDVKEEERKRERNGGEGGIYTFPMAEGSGKLRWADPKGRSEGKPAETLSHLPHLEGLPSGSTY